MTQNIDLHKLERLAYMKYQNDGLLDMFIGGMLASGTVSILLDLNGLTGVAVMLTLMGICGLLFWQGKKRITMPRLGHVKFGEMRKKKQSKGRIILIASVATTVTALVLTLAAPKMLFASGGGAAIPWFKILFPLSKFAVFCFMAWILDFPRLSLIGFILACALWADFLFGVSWAFLPAGAVCFGMGLVFLVSFLSEYPLVDEPELNSEGTTNG